MHTCELCDFSSDLFSDLKRHLETKKHIKKEYMMSVKNKKNEKNMLPFLNDNGNSVTQSNGNNDLKNVKMLPLEDNIVSKLSNLNNIDSDKNSESENVVNTKNICSCGKQFNYRSGLSRHKKTCKNLLQSQIIINQSNTISTLTSQLDTINKQIQEMQQTQQQLQQQIAKSEFSYNNVNTHSHNNTTNSHNTLTQKSINVVAYVNQNYNDAKPLTPLKEKDVMQILNFDESCGHSLEEMIVFQHSKYILDEFLGEFIINKYVKEDPKKQQIWLSNFKKLTFLVRHVLNKTDKVWLKDSNGICITKHIITPILAEIRKLIDVYIKLCNEKMHFPHTPVSEFDKLHNSGFHGVKILYEIDQKILHHKILLYIAPHFQLDRIPKMIELD